MDDMDQTAPPAAAVGATHTRAPAYWINTVSLDHVRAGEQGRFVQADHGADTRLRRLQRDDWMVFYSPRERLQAGASVQAFTALGRITDDEPYQVQATADFAPWRRALCYLACRPAPIQQLLPRLEFVFDKQHWGYPFRRGLFRIGEQDFTRIATAMAAGRCDRRWHCCTERRCCADGQRTSRC